MTRSKQGVPVSTFPSLDYVQELSAHCNNLEPFKKATEWADTNLVLEFGDKRYWLKVYRGQIIDIMEYLPMSNAFGYRVVVSGEEDAWRDLMGATKSWALLSTGRITIDGDLIEANRIHEALCLLIESLADVPEEK